MSSTALGASAANHSLRQLALVLRRWGALVVLCTLVATAIGYVVVHSQTKKYRATATVLLSGSQASQLAAGVQPASGTPQTTAGAGINYLDLGRVATSAASKLGRRVSADDVAAHVSVDPESNGQLVDVSVKWPSATLAASVANAFASSYAAQYNAANRNAFQRALKLVQAQLKTLPKTQAGVTAAAALQERAANLTILSQLDANASLVQRAGVPGGASSPRVGRVTAIAAGAGLVVSLLLAFIFEWLSSVVRDSSEFRGLYDVPLLGAIATRRAFRTKPGVRPDLSRQSALDQRHFDMVFARLRHTEPGRQLRSLLVTSAAKSEGKTTVALNLAAAAARAGESALLIDLDFRRSSLSQAGSEPQADIVEVLVEEAPLIEATHEMSSDGGEGGDGRFDILSTRADRASDRAAPPVTRAAIDGLLEAAVAAYSFVVFDAPSAVISPDAVPLLSRVDGILVVARAGVTRRPAAHELLEIIGDSSDRIIGVVVNASGEEIPAGASASGSVSAKSFVR